MSLIDLRKIKRIERVRGFQPPWRNVAVYECDNGHEARVNMHGKDMPPGAIVCPHCESKIK